MNVAAIIVAAGKGERLGGDTPKQFLDLGDGRSMLDHSIAAFLSVPQVIQIIVAVPSGSEERVASAARIEVVPGGRRRQDSMANAFARVSDSVDVVLVHDAARPFVSRQLIEATARAAGEHGAAIAALSVPDTVKRTNRNGPVRRIVETLRRDEIVLAQTPQGFRRDVLANALAAAGELDVTDEAMLIERTGVPVHVVEGEATNLKVTTAEDLARARERTRPDRGNRGSEHGASRLRIGTGYDLHRLVPGRELILGGVRIPFERGLHGHSDADIVCHAVTDAILGAAALGDIGGLFPDSEAQWKDADSSALLGQAVDTVRAAGFTIVNVDVTVIAERPRLRPYIDEMRTRLAAALAVDRTAVSIKGKTNETVDATGRGEAMACHAVALLTNDAAKHGNTE